MTAGNRKYPQNRNFAAPKKHNTAAGYVGILMILVIVGVLLGAVFNKASATDPVFRWPTKAVSVYSEVGSEWRIQRAVRQWNRAGAIQITLVDAPCESCITISEGALNLDEMGATTTFVVDVMISDCDLVLSSSMKKDPIMGAVTIHELGHCLGLNHNDSNWSIMQLDGFYYFDKPRDGDLRKLERLYK